MPRDPVYYFKDEKWEKVENNNDPCLYIMFELNSRYQRIQVGLCWDRPENEDQIDEVIRLTDGVEGVEVDKEWLANYGELWVSYELPVENLRDRPRTVDTLVEKLVKMRNITNKLKTLREAFGLRSTRMSRKRAN